MSSVNKNTNISHIFFHVSACFLGGAGVGGAVCMCVYGILQLGGTIEGEGFISDLKNNKNLGSLELYPFGLAELICFTILSIPVNNLSCNAETSSSRASSVSPAAI